MHLPVCLYHANQLLSLHFCLPRRERQFVEVRSFSLCSRKNGFETDIRSLSSPTYHIDVLYLYSTLLVRCTAQERAVTRSKGSEMIPTNDSRAPLEIQRSI